MLHQHPMYYMTSKEKERKNYTYKKIYNIIKREIEKKCLK